MSNEGHELPRPGTRVRVAWSGYIKDGVVTSVVQLRDEHKVRVEVTFDGWDDLPPEAPLTGVRTGAHQVEELEIVSAA